MDFRSAPGRRVEWLDTRIESGFSNFLYIDRQFRSHPVLRRLFSLARKHDYQSILVEDIEESDCALFAEENEAIAKRSPDFSGSKVQRLSFWRCPPAEPTSADDFIGYAVFKSDTFGDPSRPEDHLFESVLPAVRAEAQNNFVHCARTYAVSTEAGPQSVTGVLYAQQNDLTFVCAHVALRTALSAILPDGDVTYATLNQLAGIDHETRKVGRGEGGLGPDHLEAIVRGDRNTSRMAGRRIEEISLPEGAQIGAIVRGLHGADGAQSEGDATPQVLIAHHDTVVEPGDHVIVFVPSKSLVRKVEKLFQVSATFGF